MDSTDKGIVQISPEAMYEEFTRSLAAFVQKAVALIAGISIGSCLMIHLMTGQLSLKGLLGWTAAFLALAALSFFLPRLMLGPAGDR